MEQDAYRSEFAAHREAQTRTLYERHAGLPVSLAPKLLDERFGDLWQLANLTGRIREFTDTNFFTEAKRRGESALLDALRLDYARTQTDALTIEIGRYEDSCRLLWQGQKLTWHNFTATVAGETRAVLRQELVERWAESVAGGDDLRAARWHARREALSAVGYADDAACYQGRTQTDLAELARAATSFLQNTEAVYRNELARRIPQWRPAEERPQLNWADWLFWINQPAAHPAFSAHDLLPAYSDVLRGLGWRAAPQSNILFDAAERPAKYAATACYGVRPPQEVRVVYTPTAGLKAYRDFFAAAARAQHHAWTSETWRVQEPALVYTPDTALNEGYAALWGGWLGDAGWLSEYRAGLPSEAAHDLAREEAFRCLALTRRDCALLQYEIASYAAGEPDEILLRQTYANGLREATGFVHEAAWGWTELSTPFACATRLRGVLLAQVLDEYLRVRYGRRWWTIKRAGDDLVDWWNTGSLYRAEELGPLVGAGALSFDLLAENLSASLRSKT